MKIFLRLAQLLSSATIIVLWGSAAYGAIPDQGNNPDRQTIDATNPTDAIALVEVNPPSSSNGITSTPEAVLRTASVTGDTNSIVSTTSTTVGSPLTGLNPQGAIRSAEVPARLELPATYATNSATNSGMVAPPVVNPVVNPVPTPISLTTNIPNPPGGLAGISTSAGDLVPTPPPGSTVAQGQRVPDRVSTYTPAAYIGVGVNIGLNNDNTNTNNSDLGRGRFLVYGKLGFTPNISLRPAVLLGNDTTFLIPITYDFPIQAADAIQPVSFVPYLGGGAIISTRSGNSGVGFLLSGGIDLPLSRDFTATAALNVGFIRSTTDFGILLGVAYNIPGFRF